MGGHLIHELLWIHIFFSSCSAQCTFPSNLRGSWLSSDIGANELEFASSSFSGYTVHTYGTLNFTCEIQSGTKYVVKSEPFRRFKLYFNLYMCLDLTEITDATTGVGTGQLYKYYKATEPLKDAGYERVKLWLQSKVLSSYTQICTVSDYTDVPYSLLLANGTVQNNTVECPIPFLGTFGYTYDTGSGNLCESNNSYVDVCSDKTTMAWNYTLCSQIQAYSSGGVTNCVHYTEDNTGNDTVYTLHVYNQDDSVDQSTTFRFTCYKVTGYGTVYATQSPGDCVSGQNVTYVPSPGGTLVMTASVLCAYPSPPSTTTTTEVLSAGAIAGIVLAILLIITIIAVLLGFHCYRKRQREKQAEWEAANRKVDPDELSPNMRLGLPDETKYDLDRLMYSPIDEKPSKKKKTDRKVGYAKGKGSRRSMKVTVPSERMESYNEGGYMDETQRQTALDATLFAEKRKRKDGKDEFKANDPKNKQYSDRVKDMAKGKRRPFKLAALAKLRLRPKAKPRLDDPADLADGQSTQNKDIVIQVEEADTEHKRKTRFADEEPAIDKHQNKKQESKKGKALEDIDTLSDIVDNEMGVNDLSDEDKEPRLKLPNLNPKKKEKKKRSQDKYSLVSGTQRTSAMPLNTKFMPPKAKLQTEESFIEPVPVIRNALNLSSMTPLQRIHRKESSNLWKEALLDGNNGKIDLEELKKNMSENRWRKLLEELYRDKKYFDYVKKSSSNTETDLGSAADDTLQYLYGRALFWEEHEPIPARPPSSVRRMYSRHDNTRGSERRAKSSAGFSRSNTGIQRSASLKRSATTLSRVKGSGYGFKIPPRTPSTQVSRLKRRETTTGGKRAKSNTNEKPKTEHDLIPNGGLPLTYFDGGTQTDFSPPLSPLLLTDSALELGPFDQMDRMSLPGSVIIEEEGQSVVSPAPSGNFIHPPPGPIRKEVTKSDIKLEEVNENDLDTDYNHENFTDEVTVAI